MPSKWINLIGVNILEFDTDARAIEKTKHNYNIRIPLIQIISVLIGKEFYSIRWQPVFSSKINCRRSNGKGTK